MADAQTPSPAEVLAFLSGAGEIDGVGFGDRHPTLPGAFWWRRHLPLLAAQAPAQPADMGNPISAAHSQPGRAVMQQALDALQTIASFATGEGDVCEIIAKRARAAIAALSAAMEKP